MLFALSFVRAPCFVYRCRLFFSLLGMVSIVSSGTHAGFRVAWNDSDRMDLSSILGWSRVFFSGVVRC